MSYAEHRSGFRVSRQILTGINCFADSDPGVLIGDMFISGSNLMTHQAYIDEITVQLAQPRGNSPLSAYYASYPTQSALGIILPNPTDAIWYFWDIGPFNPVNFILNPIPGFPDPSAAVMQIRPWCNGVSGGGSGSAPASARTATDGSYKIPINRRFKDGLLAFFQNPEKTAVITCAGRVGNFVVGDVLTGGGGGSGTGGKVRVVTGGGDTLVLEPDWLSPITHYTVGRGITGGTSGATATVATYESQLLQQLNCQVNMVWAPTRLT